jgi:hypothetical protein
MTQHELFPPPAPKDDTIKSLIEFASTCHECNCKLGQGDCRDCKTAAEIETWGEVT